MISSMTYQYNSQNMLLEAIIKGYINNVALTINSGELDINEPMAGYNNTPLKAAVGIGNKEMASLLIDKGADVNIKSGDREETPLHEAAAKGWPRIVNLLLKHGADVNSKNLDNYKPAELAEKYKNKKIAKQLKEFTKTNQ